MSARACDRDSQGSAADCHGHWRRTVPGIGGVGCAARVITRALHRRTAFFMGGVVALEKRSAACRGRDRPSEVMLVRECHIEAANSSPKRSKKAVAGEIAKAKSHAVLTILGARKIAVSAPLRSKILACTDITTLEHWIQRAVTVAGSEDLVQ